MAIVKMRKIRIAALLRDRDDIIVRLQKLGAVDIDTARSELFENDGEPGRLAELEAQTNDIKEALILLKKHSGTKKPLFAVRKQLTETESEEIKQSLLALADRAQAVLDIQNEMHRLSDGINRDKNLISSLEPWKGMRADLSDMETEYAAMMFGTLPPSADSEALLALVEAEAPGTAAEILGRDAKGTNLYFIYLKSFEQELNRILKNADFTRITFKELKGTPAENISALTERMAETEKSVKQAAGELKEQASLIPQLEAASDCAMSELERVRVLGRLIRTSSVFVLTGWVPEDSEDQVRKTLEAHFDCAVETFMPGDDEPDYPIALKNNKFFAPFESITEMFNLPLRNNIDPSALMAPFFIVFFGMMLSDAVYGIILSAATGFIIKKYNPRGMMGNILRIFFMCGISTLFWGAMFGGWLGNIVDVVSGGKVTIKPLWFNPMDDPTKLLIWSLAFGFIHIMTSLAIKGYMLIRDKDLSGFIFDVLPWFMILFGAGMIFLGGIIGNVGKVMTGLGLITIIFMRARDEKNIVKRIFRGIGGLYDIVGYISDVLSYSRLLALGLATGVIANVFNTMAALGGKSIIGVILFVVVVSIGTVFNIAVNVLGAYVHTSRLQYIEFFTRFYEGGGRPFRPLKTNTQYTELKNEEANLR